MKIKSYNILFRLFSYLADKTNGTSFFVNYKLMLGTLIIGLAAVSCNNSKQLISRKDPDPRIIREGPMCYVAVRSVEDTIPTIVHKDEPEKLQN